MIAFYQQLSVWIEYFMLSRLNCCYVRTQTIENILYVDSHSHLSAQLRYDHQLQGRLEHGGLCGHPLQNGELVSVIIQDRVRTPEVAKCM